jgi:hypothetical protein
MLSTNALPGVAPISSLSLAASNATPILGAGHHLLPPDAAPGLYAVRPYSMIVLVPPDMDRGILGRASDNTESNMASIDNMPRIDPQIHLEKIPPR